MAVVVTGIGTLTPYGFGLASVTEGPAPGRLLPETDFKALLGAKGLRSIDRLGQMTLAACQDALAASGLEAAPQAADMGVVLGTAFGGLSSITGFFEERLKDGPRLVTASSFGNIVMNAAASQVSLRHGFTALNATITSACASGLDALGWALDYMQAGRARALLAGGADELSPDTRATLAELGWAGFEPAEGAVVWLLEQEEDARARGATVLARVLGHAAAFDGGPLLGRAPDPAVLARAAEQALAAAGLDAAELVATNAVTPDFEGPNAIATHPLVGDMLAAGGPLAGALAVRRLMTPDGPQSALVLATSPSGHCSALVLAR